MNETIYTAPKPLIRPQHITDANNLEYLSEEQLEQLYAVYESMLNEDDRSGYLTDAEYAEACFQIKKIEKLLIKRKIEQLEKEHEEEIKQLIMRKKGVSTLSDMSIRHNKDKDNDGMGLG